MTALASLFARDTRIALRVGGGAMMGVLFFLTVVTLVPFAIGPDSGAAAADRTRHPVARRPIVLAADARPPVRDRS